MNSKKELKKIIKKVESGELDLSTEYDFHEVEYSDGLPKDIYIVHTVEDVEFNEKKISVLFAETEPEKEFRLAYEQADDEEKNILLNDYKLNELGDSYDYNNVVGVIIDGVVTML